MKKSTVHQLLILVAGGVLALTIYEFAVQPAISKVAGVPKPPQLR
jgi:hypothetical protein